MSQPGPPREDIHPIFQKHVARPDRLVHLIPDELAEAVPNHPLFAFTKSVNPRDGIVDVSCWQFANAVNRTSWYLRLLLGLPKNFETIGYMGPSDLRYFFFMLGAIKVGYKMLFLSPRNNLEGNIKVLEGADCHIFLRAKETNIDPILRERPMLSWVVPELSELLLDNPVQRYPYTKTFEQAWSDPCLVLHTTGSTGLPKPITWKVGILSTYEAWRTNPPIDGYVPTTEIYQQARRAYTSMPLFHTSGLNAGITWAMLLGVTLVYGAPHVIPNAAYTDKMHQIPNIDASMGAPSIYEELSRDSESLERINRLHYVVASGAPLSHKAGNLISQHTRVICNLGATETACLQRLAPSIEDWPYFYWHPSHSGIEMREAMGGLYELFIVRDPKLRLYQGVFNTFPELSEWSMKDLYSRHPTKPYLYMYRCRKDDVIVLSNGEKVAPALMEATLMSHPLVKGAMIVGQGKFQPAAIVDLFDDVPDDPLEKRKLLLQLAPAISEANSHAPAHGKLDQNHICFTDPLKPIRYLGQGKIQRRATLALYEEDVEELYNAVDDGADSFRFSALSVLKPNDTESVASWLELLIQEITRVDIRDRESDIFASGVDSLQVMQMAHELRFQARCQGMGSNAASIFSPVSIYTNPTIKQLTQYVYTQLGPCTTLNDSNVGGDSGYYDKESALEKMQQLSEKYTSDLPQAKEPPSLSSSQKMVILLTGSTGSLGSYILDTLQQDKNVSRIICLNRSPDAGRKQKEINFNRGLDCFFDRVEFFQADLAQECFGLTDELYQELLNSVTHIIHNQWAVNFNWPLSSFEPFIAGVRKLVDFSCASTLCPLIMFISSVSAVGSWNATHDVPEEPIHDLHTAAKMGYGQSKLVSELILDKAAKVSGVQSICCRVGIVAGPVEQSLGMWNAHEYIPSIMISSPYLGAFPVTFPSRDRVDWIPVDNISKILHEILTFSHLSLRHQPFQTKIYHVVNPSWISWSKLAPQMLTCYSENFDVQAVSFEKWVYILRNAAKMEPTNVKRNPAVKLIHFFENVLHESGESRALSSIQAMEASPTLKNMSCVNMLWIDNWMRQWGLASTASSDDASSSESDGSSHVNGSLLHLD